MPEVYVKPLCRLPGDALPNRERTSHVISGRQSEVGRICNSQLLSCKQPVHMSGEMLLELGIIMPMGHCGRLGYDGLLEMGL